MAGIVNGIFLKETFFYKITIFKDSLFILKFGSVKVVKNIFPEKISRNL